MNIFQLDGDLAGGFLAVFFLGLMIVAAKLAARRGPAENIRDPRKWE